MTVAYQQEDKVITFGTLNRDAQISNIFMIVEAVERESDAHHTYNESMMHPKITHHCKAACET